MRARTSVVYGWTAAIAIVVATTVLAQTPAPSSSAPSSGSTRETTAPQNVSKTETDAEKSASERFAAQLGAIRGSIIDLIIIVALGFFARAVITEIRSGSTVIDLIEVPKDLAEQGYTPLVIAQRLHSEIAALASANTTHTALNEGFEVGGSQIDFAVPSAGVSFRNIVRYVRQQIGRPEPRLRGEIVREREMPAPANPGQASLNAVPPKETLRVLLRMSNGRAASSEISVDTIAQLPELIRNAAFAAADLADPYLVASYWFAREQGSGTFPMTLQAVRRCLSTTPVDRHDRAYFIWGNIFAAQRNYAAAEEKYHQAISLGPKNSRGYLGLGNLFRAMRRPDEAFATYKKAAKHSRKDAAPLSSLGYICNDRHRYSEALPYFRAALKRNPRHVNSLNGIAWSFWKLDLLDEAEAAWNRAIDIDPSYGWPYRNRALMLRAQRRYPEAIEYLETAAKTAIAAEAFVTWGDVLVDMGDLDAAGEKYKRAAESNPALALDLGGEGFRLLRQHRFADAIRVSDEAIQRDEFYMPARIHRAEALRKLGRFDETVATCKEIFKRDRYLASSLVYWGMSIQSKSPDEAMSLFEQATAMDPLHSWSWRTWADAQRKRRRYDVAIAGYRKALATDRFDSYAHLGWGRMLSSMGRESEASEHYQLAHQLDGRNAAALRNVAESDIRGGRIAEARARFERAIADWPQIAALSVQQGEMLQRLGFLAEALASFDRALAIDGRDPDALQGQATVLRRLRRFDEAATLVELAVDIEPTHYAARELATTLRDSGDMDGALEALESAHSRDPFNAAIVIDWGRLLAKAGRHEHAAEKYRLALALDGYETRASVALADTMFEQHRIADAINQYRAAAAIDPFDPGPRWGMGAALEAMQQYRAAIDHYRAAAELRPDDPSSYIRWGSVLRRMGLFREALQRYRQAREVDRRSGSALDRLLSILIDLGDRDEAMKEIEQATSTESPPAEIFIAAGHALHRLGETADTKAMYRKGLRMTPFDANGLIGFANTLPGRFDEYACKILELTLGPDSSELRALRELWFRLRRQGAPNDILERLDQIHQQNPDDLQALIEASSLLVLLAEDADRDAVTARKSDDAAGAMAAEQYRDQLYLEADEKLRVTADRKPWDAGIPRRRGAIRLATRRPDEALLHFDRAIRLDRYDWVAFLGRSKALFELKDRRKAINAARRAARLRAEDVNALINIAATLNDRDEPAEAIDVLNTAVAIAPTHQAMIDLRLKVTVKLAVRPDLHHQPWFLKYRSRRSRE